MHTMQQLLLMLVIVLGACSPKTSPKKSENLCQNNIKQGIKGQVFWREGNWRPSKDKNNRPQEQAVVRNICIYQLTKESQTTKNGKFYENPTTKMLTQISTDTNGCFSVELPQGEYSVFVEEEFEGKKMLYANSFDNEMNLNKVVVRENKITETKIIIDYKAKY
ncbi:MAG: hypothetical protein OHK0045_15320 [Raineya sp.]